MRRIGEYDHLNSDTPITIQVEGIDISISGPNSMSVLVKSVDKSNYGLHRFLSELVRKYDAGELKRSSERDMLMEGIKQSLERGAH